MKAEPWERGFGGVEGDLVRMPLRELPLPVLVLRESALAHNLAVMQAWCDARGLSLAPHGKTTLAPELIRRQLEAGAWGMTAATVPQLAVMRAAGARRVILANELVGAPEIAWFERERAGIEAYCLIVSARVPARCRRCAGRRRHRGVRDLAPVHGVRQVVADRRRGRRRRRDRRGAHVLLSRLRAARRQPRGPCRASRPESGDPAPGQENRPAVTRRLCRE